MCERSLPFHRQIARLSERYSGFALAHVRDKPSLRIAIDRTKPRERLVLRPLQEYRPAVRPLLSYLRRNTSSVQKPFRFFHQERWCREGPLKNTQRLRMRAVRIGKGNLYVASMRGSR